MTLLFSTALPLEPAQAPQDDQTPTIKLDVAVVNILCSVRDSKGRLVANLAKGDFEIREDGKRQEILYFTRETTLPLTLGLLVDSSVSQAGVIERERRAAAAFFRQVLSEKDIAFLVSFDTAVDLLRDVTGSVDLLERALDQIHVNAPFQAPPGPFPAPIQVGGTHLYDAVYLAATEVLHKEAGRKAVVVLTDGVDQGSQMDRDEAIEAAQRTDTTIYAILFRDRDFYRFAGGGFDGDDTLKEMTEATGGRLFRPSSDEELAIAFQQISEELRSQYSLGYSPSNTAKDGTYRRIEVRVRGRGLRVQARRGYYAPLDDSYKAR